MYRHLPSPSLSLSLSLPPSSLMQHVHKALGILSVASFVYRYGVVYPERGTLGLADGSAFDWATMAVHLLLAFSSVIFRVPGKRIETKPMIIYEEYRQHAMVFTLRCFSVFAAATLLPVYWPSAPQCVFPILVALHHLKADAITRAHGSGSTAVRALSDKLQVSSFYKRVGMLYSFYQFLAIASHVFPHGNLPDAAYNAIIAIQSSAFMMTLYRKRIIRGRTHMVVYSSCLLLSAWHIVNLIGYKRTLLAVLAFTARINTPRSASKYAVWTFWLLLPHLCTLAVKVASGEQPVRDAVRAVFGFSSGFPAADNLALHVGSAVASNLSHAAGALWTTSANVSALLPLPYDAARDALSKYSSMVLTAQMDEAMSLAMPHAVGTLKYFAHESL